MTSATKLFEFISAQREFVHDRQEIASPNFWALRRSMAAIMRRLGQYDDIDATEAANSMRVLLFTWLTSPVAFDASILDALNTFGNADSFDARWGTRGELKSAMLSAERMIAEGSSLRVKLAATIDQLQSQGTSFKIFCHRKTRQLFDSLELARTSTPLNDGSFLHSVRDYAAADPFGVLLKIGPLRSKGWGSAPDAIRSAPKFEKMIQLVWSGCADDPRFGYDPVEPPPVQGSGTSQPNDSICNSVTWKRQVTKSGDDPIFASPYDPEHDEFSSFSQPNQHGARRPALLLEIPSRAGILYPRSARVLSFDSKAANDESLSLRVPGETLLEGVYVIQTQIAEVDFGETFALEGGYSLVWKQRIREELQSSPEAFCRSLRSNGLELINLRSCVDYWAQPSSAAIHSPLQRRHFQILIETLAVGEAGTSPPRHDPRSWWQRAWDEIRISRGEAIQLGRQGQEIVDQQSLQLLKVLLPEIRAKSAMADEFKLFIPPGNELRGAFAFYKVLSIEDGFLAPESEIKFIRGLDSLEQWKVT
jgi:hypothetical protein